MKPTRTSPKTFHINLYKGKLYQYNESMQKKVYMCSDLIRISRGTESTLTIDIRPSISIASKQKILHFETVSEAKKFQEYIEYRNDYGSCVRSTFVTIDAKKTGYITRVTLLAALNSEDLQPTEEDLTKMMALGEADDKERVTFLGFFRVFLGTPVYTIRGCLQEWLQRSRYQHEDGSVRRRPDSTAISLLSGSGIRLLHGEEIKSVDLNLRWMIGSGRGQQEASTSTAGGMIVTNFRLCLISNKCLFSNTAFTHSRNHSRHDRPASFDVLHVPLNTLHKAYLVGVGIGQYRRELMLVTKDLRSIRITFPQSEQSLAKEDSALQLLLKQSFPGDKKNLFAFKYGEAFVPRGGQTDPQGLYWLAADIRAEYRRQGLTELPDQWKVNLYIA